LCRNLTYINHFNENFDSIFSPISCPKASVLAEGPSRDVLAVYKNLQIRLLKACGRAIVESKQRFLGGYFETRIRLAGQGSNFDGIGYGFYLRECASCSKSDEINFKWYGNPASAGKSYTNSKVESRKNDAFEKFLMNGPGKPKFNGFVKYAIYWSDEEISWYINDIKVHSVYQDIPTKPLKLYFAIWDASFTPGKPFGKMNWKSYYDGKYFMEIEYIKICAI
jgi:beta-glucanase (GH16 family)